MIKNNGLALVGMFLIFSGMSNAQECPVLDTGNIGDAACSSNSSPYLPGKLDSVIFAATTPCPVGLGIKKKLQTIFKGKKEYSASDTKVVSSGVALCTYKLTEDWKKALKSKEDNLVLKAVFPNREHANYWSAPTFGSKCPALEESDLDNLEHGSVHVTSKDSRYSYNFEVVPFEKNILKNPFTKLKLDSLAGAESLKTPYEVKCEYTYHSGTEETKILLVGKQKIPERQQK